MSPKLVDRFTYGNIVVNSRDKAKATQGPYEISMTGTHNIENQPEGPLSSPTCPHTFTQLHLQQPAQHNLYWSQNLID